MHRFGKAFTKVSALIQVLLRNHQLSFNTLHRDFQLNSFHPVLNELHCLTAPAEAAKSSASLPPQLKSSQGGQKVPYRFHCISVDSERPYRQSVGILYLIQDRTRFCHLKVEEGDIGPSAPTALGHAFGHAPRVAVTGCIKHQNPGFLALGRHRTPVPAFLNVFVNIGSENRTVAGSDHLDREILYLLHGLDGEFLERTDNMIKVVPAGMGKIVQLIIEHPLVGIVATQKITGEQDAMLPYEGEHRVGPMEEWSLYELQSHSPKIDGIAIAHRLDIHILVQYPFYERNTIFGCDYLSGLCLLQDFSQGP